MYIINPKEKPETVAEFQQRFRNEIVEWIHKITLSQFTYNFNCSVMDKYLTVKQKKQCGKIKDTCLILIEDLTELLRLT